MDDQARRQRTLAPPYFRSGFGANLGTDADVFFDGRESNKDCIVDQAVQVHSINVIEGYPGTIQIASALTVTGTLKMDSGVATISDVPGNPNHIRVQVNLNGNAQLDLYTGKLNHVDVNVNRTGGVATMNVVADQGQATTPKIVMVSTALNISGTLNWQSGNVGSFGSLTTITIAAGAAFHINAVGNTWAGLDPPPIIPLDFVSNPSHLSIVNHGMVALNSTGMATIIGIM